MATHHGQCHCGQVSFSVEGEIAGAFSCNCSYCSRMGWVLWLVPEDKFHHVKGETTTYTFNKHVIQHKFCPKCGTHPFGLGKNPKTGEPMAAVNLRCVDGIDLDKIAIAKVDGRAF